MRLQILTFKAGLHRRAMAVSLGILPSHIVRLRIVSEMEEGCATAAQRRERQSSCPVQAQSCARPAAGVELADHLASSHESSVEMQALRTVEQWIVSFNCFSKLSWFVFALLAFHSASFAEWST